jgi:hypothetical protein
VSAYLVQRFWTRVNVDMPDRCWEWTGPRFTKGYGHSQLTIDGTVYIGAHRIAYVLTNGPVPNGTMVCHTCDNPPCCNPDHLWAGTYTDNQLDAFAKGRRSRHNAGTFPKGGW